MADAVFQIERLYRFTAKFFPRWTRYLMYEGHSGSHASPWQPFG